jgi:hypothetical protein
VSGKKTVTVLKSVTKQIIVLAAAIATRIEPAIYVTTQLRLRTSIDGRNRPDHNSYRQSERTSVWLMEHGL